MSELGFNDPQDRKDVSRVSFHEHQAEFNETNQVLRLTLEDGPRSPTGSMQKKNAQTISLA